MAFIVMIPGWSLEECIEAGEQFESLHLAKVRADEVGGGMVYEEHLRQVVYDSYEEAWKQYVRENPPGPPTVADLKWIRPDLYW